MSMGFRTGLPDMATGLRRDIRDKILADYKKVQEVIFERLSGKELNFYVMQTHYISPSVCTEVVPLEHGRGEYKYFLGIRESLEHAWVYGKLRKEMIPNHAPDYLRDLAE